MKAAMADGMVSVGASPYAVAGLNWLGQSGEWIVERWFRYWLEAQSVPKPLHNPTLTVYIYIYGVPPNATDRCIHVPVCPVIIGLDNGSTPDKATDHYVNQRWLSVYRVVNSVRLSDAFMRQWALSTNV